jgi:hypothetical protein
LACCGRLTELTILDIDVLEHVETIATRDEAREGSPTALSVLAKVLVDMSMALRPPSVREQADERPT